MVPGLVRPALLGSLEGRRRGRVEMQDLEEELKGLGQGRAGLSRFLQQARRGGNGVEELRTGV